MQQDHPIALNDEVLQMAFEQMMDHGESARASETVSWENVVEDYAPFAEVTPRLFVSLLASTSDETCREISRIWQSRIQVLIQPGSNTARQLSNLLLHEDSRTLERALAAGHRSEDLRRSQLAKAFKQANSELLDILVRYFKRSLVADRYQLGNCIQRCPQNLATAFGDWLRRHGSSFVTTDYVSEEVSSVYLIEGEAAAWRLLRVLCRLNPDACQGAELDSRLPDRFHKIISDCRSAHGRLSLERDLPPLVDILTR